jgi:type IV secretory pathway TraG/TraD family ATPase VirD4
MLGMEEKKKYSQSFAQQVNVSESSHELRSLLPEQIRNMPTDEMIVLPSGMTAARRPYYKDPEFTGRYDPDPYHPK